MTASLARRLGSHDGTAGARAVLISPIRELALQTYKVVTEIAKHTDLRSAVLVGGDSMSVQFAELAAAPDIIVATPGRLLHHLQEVQGFTLKSVKHIVLDEADRLFEMGLGEQVRPRRDSAQCSTSMSSERAM
jgi:ATP-dependent RNA helicase DDX54/DBP10